jgi:hypothetical protein
MDAETFDSKNYFMMTEATILDTQAPQDQLKFTKDEHRPLLNVDRTEGITGARHILLPVDDTKVSEKLPKKIFLFSN